MNERRAAVALPLPRPGPPPLPRVPVPSRRVLNNGLRLVAIPWGALPQVVLRLVLPGGSVGDPLDKPGMANLAGQVLIEGTELRSAEVLNARLDGLGASLDVHVGHDFTEVELSLLSETLPEALALFAETVTRPAFPPREVERVRREAMDALAARDDEPANVADDRVAEAIFGTGHPYGRPSVGTAEGVAAASVDDLRSFHDAVFRPAGGVIVAVGELEVDRLAELCAKLFAGWSGTGCTPHLPGIPEGPQLAGEQIHLPWPDAQQAEIRIGGRGLARSSADWIPAAVANYILGGSTITGRLGANLREDKGWTYGARSAFAAGIQPGGWIAVAEMTREIDRMAEEPVSEEELRRAQRALVLSLPRAFETPNRVASRFVTVEAFGLPSGYWEQFPAAVRSVTADDVQRVARDHFRTDRLVRVLVG
jgi:zinc protease